MSNGSEKNHFYHNFILNNDVFAVYFRKNFYIFITGMVLTQVMTSVLPRL